MSDTKLKSISLRNWNTVREASIEFPERGLVVVRGINTASKGKLASIGSGKTSLGEALSRALFGLRGRYTHLGSYSTRGEGSTYVCLNSIHHSKPLKIEMGFKCEELNPLGEGLRFTYDSTEVNRARLEETRSDLAKLLTVPTDLAGWTVHLDGDLLKFDDLSENKAVQLLMAALMQPRWNFYHKSASAKAVDLKHDHSAQRQGVESGKRALVQAEVELQTARASLARAKSVYAEEQKQLKANLETVSKQIEQIAKRLGQRKTRMAEIQKEVDRRIALTAEKAKALEIDVNEKQEAKDKLNEQYNRLHWQSESLRKDWLKADTQLNESAQTPDKCPTCGKPWDRAQTQLEQLGAAEARTKAAYGVAFKAAGVAGDRVKAAERLLSEAKSALTAAKAEAPIDDLSQEFEKLENENSEDQDTLTEAQQEKAQLEQGPDKTEMTRFETQVIEREKNTRKCQENIDQAAASVAETEELLRIVEYWQEAFGPAGIPNMILNDAIEPLNATSRRVSALMSGGTLDVGYATNRQLKSGVERAELTITVRNDLGSQRAEGSSKGESGLTNLIVAETLAEVGGIANRIGYRFYDEVGANQDEIVRRSIYSYLSETAQRYGILIFLVSHAPEAANYADYTLIAEKRDEGTAYYWAKP